MYRLNGGLRKPYRDTLGSTNRNNSQDDDDSSRFPPIRGRSRPPSRYSNSPDDDSFAGLSGSPVAGLVGLRSSGVGFRSDMSSGRASGRDERSQPSRRSSVGDGFRHSLAGDRDAHGRRRGTSSASTTPRQMNAFTRNDAARDVRDSGGSDFAQLGTSAGDSSERETKRDQPQEHDVSTSNELAVRSESKPPGRGRSHNPENTALQQELDLLTHEALLRGLVFFLTPRIVGQFEPEQPPAAPALPSSTPASQAAHPSASGSGNAGGAGAGGVSGGARGGASTKSAVMKPSAASVDRRQPQSSVPHLPRRVPAAPRTRAQEQALQRRRQRQLRRQRAQEKERQREAHERELMLAEEWRHARQRWWGTGQRHSAAWRSVRVFISSTFNDMHGERDALTRTVFPALNTLARSRRVRVIPIDLRWGLTAEDTSDTGLGALEHCLLEIDHARPFFLTLVGERYGWIPPHYRVSDRPEFDWVRDFPLGHSITDMEIQHGFLRKPFTPTYAFSFKRDPSFIDTIDDANARRIFAFDYHDDDILARRNELRQKMMDHPFCSCREYSCEYGGLDEEGKPHVTGLQEFEAMVLEDLWRAIQQEFPPPPRPPSPLHVERAFHLHFVEERSRHFIGREALMKQLEEHADGDATRESLPLVVVGEPGSGKTSLVTSFAKRYNDSRPRCSTLVHVVSASPTSTDVRETLLRLCRELDERFDLSWDPANEELEYQAVKELFFVILERAGRKALGERYYVLLVLDAVNQFNPFYNSASMDWMPSFSPPGIRAILSTTPDAQCLRVLQRRDPRPPQLDVPPLTLRERKEIVVKHLAMYRKKLLPSQLDLLLQKEESNKPLYLLTVCEELRLQAQYGMGGKGVDSKIQEFPDNIPALMHTVLDRVERDLASWAITADALTIEGFLSQSSLDEEASARVAEVESEDGREVGSMDGKGTGPSPSPAGSVVDGQSGAGWASPMPSGEGETGDTGSVPGTPVRLVSSSSPRSPTRDGGKEHHARLAQKVGKRIVRDALTLLECSRHGLREQELLELLAPRGKQQLPPVVWARLYRSLELYLRPLGEQDQGGMIGFFHMQLPFAIRRKYLQHDRRAEAEVCSRLASYFLRKADPTQTGKYLGRSRRYFSDLVYYQLKALRISDLRRTLGSLTFIERMGEFGAGAMELLLRDYNDAQEEIRGWRYSVVKEVLGSGVSNESSRAKVLQWLRDFATFVGSLHAPIAEYPSLTFQYALNQPDESAPCDTAEVKYEKEMTRLWEELDRREKIVRARARAQDEEFKQAAAEAESKRASARKRSDADEAHVGASGTAAAGQQSGAAKNGKQLVVATDNGTSVSGSLATPRDAVARVLDKSAHTLATLPLLCSLEVQEAFRAELKYLSRKLTVRDVPRRFFRWVNKPQQNRIVADFSGFSVEVTTVAVPSDPSRNLIAVGLQDGLIQLVDAGTGESLRELTVGGHSKPVTCLSFSGDSMRLLSGGQDSKVVVWDVSSSVRLDELTEHTEAITAAVWIDPDSRRKGGKSKLRRRGARSLLSSSFDSSLILWQEKLRAGGQGGVAETKYEIVWHQDWMQTPALSLAYNSSKRLVAAGHADGQIQVWDARAPALGLIDLLVFPAHRFSGVTALAFAPDGDSIVSGALDATIRVWKREIVAADTTYREERVSGTGHANAITSVAFSAEGSRFVSTGLDKKCILWDVESNAEVLTLTGHSDKVYCACFLPGHTTRVVSGAFDRSVKVWDVGEADVRRVAAPVKRADEGPYSHSRGRGSSMRMPRQSSQQRQPSTDNIPSQPSSTGRLAPESTASEGGGGGHARRFSFSGAGGAAGKRGVDARGLPVGMASYGGEPTLQPSAPAGAHAERILAATVAQDGSVAVTGGADREIKVWDVASGEEACVLLGHTAAVTALHITDKRESLISGDAAGVIMVWHGKTFDHIFTINAWYHLRITALTATIVSIRLPPSEDVAAGADGDSLLHLLHSENLGIDDDPENVEKRPVLFAATEDGRLGAWFVDTGEVWNVDLPRASLRPVGCLRCVSKGTSLVPPSAAPAPVNSGILSGAMAPDVHRPDDLEDDYDEGNEDADAGGRVSSVSRRPFASGSDRVAPSSSREGAVGGASVTNRAFGKRADDARRGSQALLGTLLDLDEEDALNGDGSSARNDVETKRDDAEEVVERLRQQSGPTMTDRAGNARVEKSWRRKPSSEAINAVSTIVRDVVPGEGVLESPSGMMEGEHRRRRGGKRGSGSTDTLSPWDSSEDPAATVPGLTPMHRRDRLMVFGLDGKLMVVDLETMEVLHRDECPAPAGGSNLSASAISPDGSRIAVAASLPEAAQRVSVSPAASLFRATNVPVDPPCSAEVDADEEGDGTLGRGGRPSKRRNRASSQHRRRFSITDVREQQRRKVEEDVQAQRERAAAWRKRLEEKREQRRIARRRRERQRASRIRGAARRGVAEGSGGTAEEEEEESDSDGTDLELFLDDDEEEGEAGRGRRPLGVLNSNYDGLTGRDSVEGGSMLEDDEEDLGASRNVISVGFSSDGTWLGAGCSEKLLSVVDPSRPELGPVAQFVAYGEVTAVALGPGVTPWPEEKEAFHRIVESEWAEWEDEDEDAETESSSDSGSSVSDGDGSMSSRSWRSDDVDVVRRRDAPPQTTLPWSKRGVVSTSSSNKASPRWRGGRGRSTARPHPSSRGRGGGRSRRSGSVDGRVEAGNSGLPVPSRPRGGSTSVPPLRRESQELSRKQLRRWKRAQRRMFRRRRRTARVGDGKGSIGLVVMGDSTGAVFILRLMDAVRAVEARREDALLKQQADLVQTIKKERDEARRRQLEAEAEAERAEASARAKAVVVKMELLEFPSLWRALAALPTHRLQVHDPRDREFTAKMLATMGLDIGLVGRKDFLRLCRACPAILGSLSPEEMLVQGLEHLEGGVMEQAASRSSVVPYTGPRSSSTKGPDKAPFWRNAPSSVPGSKTANALLSPRMHAEAHHIPGTPQPVRPPPSVGPSERSVRDSRRGSASSLPPDEGASSATGFAARTTAAGTESRSSPSLGSRAKTEGRTRGEVEETTSQGSLLDRRPQLKENRGALVVDTARGPRDPPVGFGGTHRPLTMEELREPRWQVLQEMDPLDVVRLVDGFRIPKTDQGVLVRGMLEQALEIARSNYYASAPKSTSHSSASSGSPGGGVSGGNRQPFTPAAADGGRSAASVQSGGSSRSRLQPGGVRSKTPTSSRGRGVRRQTMQAPPGPGGIRRNASVNSRSSGGSLQQEEGPAPSRSRRSSSMEGSVPLRGRAGSPKPPPPRRLARERSVPPAGMSRSNSSTSVKARPSASSEGAGNSGSIHDERQDEDEDGAASPPKDVVQQTLEFLDKGISEEEEESRLKATRAKYFARPHALMCVFGGAGGLHDLLVPQLRSLIRRGVVTAAIAAGAMILDGGTKAGVMDMIGSSLQFSDPYTLRILGVCPGQLVEKPTRIRVEGDSDLDEQDEQDEEQEEQEEPQEGSRSARGPGVGERRSSVGSRGRRRRKSVSRRRSLDDKTSGSKEGSRESSVRKLRRQARAAAAAAHAAVGTDMAPLEPHHSHFVLVPSGEWGGETSSMFTVASVLSDTLPSVAVVANGGMISKKEILSAVRLGLPVTVIEGSGRLADRLALAVHAREESPGDEAALMSILSDAEELEIVMQGDLYLYNVTGAPAGLQDLLLSLIVRQRDRLRAQRDGGVALPGRTLRAPLSPSSEKAEKAKSDELRAEEEEGKEVAE